MLPEEKKEVVEEKEEQVVSGYLARLAHNLSDTLFPISPVFPFKSLK